MDQKNHDEPLKINEDVELFHNFGVSLRTRTIFLGSAEYNDAFSENGIDWKVADRTIKNLHILSKSSRATINIISYSAGGDFSASIAIYEMMRKLHNKIIMTAYGCCMSGATVIMQGADVRQMTKNSRFMIHDGYISFEGKSQDLKVNNAENDVNAAIMHKIYFDRAHIAGSKITRKLIEEKCKTDFYMSADEAKKLGFIDNVV